LANVGILLALGRPGLALGSLLLFATNYFAILLTGAMVFGLLGFSEAAMIERTDWAKRKAIAIALAAILLITIPLSYTSYGIVVNNAITARIYKASEQWLKESSYRLISINTETADNTIYMVLRGEGEIPPLDILIEQLSGNTFGKDIRLETVQSTVKYLQLVKN
jgi:hypothetical protein